MSTYPRQWSIKRALLQRVKRLNKRYDSRNEDGRKGKREKIKKEKKKNEKKEKERYI